MDNNGSNGSFRYTYSAKEQRELKQIREKYECKEEDKMEKIRRLDRGVTKKAQGIAITVGMIGVLIFGFGMSLAMSELGNILFNDGNMAMLIGIIIGSFGGTLAGLAYPIYELILKRERKRIAPEIIKLTDELMK